VDKLVTITPPRIRLFGEAGRPIEAEVLIRPEKKYHFEIVNILAENGENINFDYESIKTEKGEPAYLVRVENKKKDKGRFVDKIILKTTSKYQPEISLRVSGNLI
jgi:hypothetical protein